MITFNENERLTPTVVRRRISTVRSHLDKQLAKVQEAEARVEKLQIALARAKEEEKIQGRSVKSLSTQLNELENKKVEMKRKVGVPLVTDHAVVNYLERVMGIDVQKIRNVIIGKDGRKIRNMDGEGSIDRDKYSLVITNNVVATILGDGMVDLNPIELSTYKFENVE